MTRSRRSLHLEPLEDRWVLHAHIPIDFIDGKIELMPTSSDVRVFAGSFDTFLLITEEPSISDPSVIGLPTHLTPGAIIRYTVTSPLLHHDGADFADTGAANVEWFDPGPVFITGTSGIQADKVYGQVEANGKMHVHPLIFLNNGATGAYGAQFFLTTTAPGIEASDRFWHVWNFGLGETEFASALAAFTFSADAGGPYTMDPLEGVLLQGMGTGAGSLVYEWDLNGDGEFGDVTGDSPLINGALLSSLGVTPIGTIPIQLRVSNEFEEFATSSTTIEILSTDAVAPTVTDVFVSGANWNTTFFNHLATQGIGDATYGYRIPEGAAQLHTLPWNQLRSISFRFSESVNITADDLSLFGVVSTYDVDEATFSYDDATQTARWSFASNWGRDKILAVLRSVTDLAGNPLAVDGFTYRFNVLPGNASSTDSTVTAVDWNSTRARLFTNTTTANYSLFADVDGNGTINAVDWNFVRSRLFTTINGLGDPTDPGVVMTAAFVPLSEANETQTSRLRRLEPSSAIAPNHVLDALFSEGEASP